MLRLGRALTEPLTRQVWRRLRGSSIRRWSPGREGHRPASRAGWSGRASDRGHHLERWGRPPRSASRQGAISREPAGGEPGILHRDDHELYAERKGWEVGQLEVDVDYTPAQRGSPTRCTTVVRLPEHLPAERRERLMQVAATSQAHRTLEGEIVFDERVELTTAAKAGPDHSFEPRGRRIALLSGLRGALRGRPT